MENFDVVVIGAGLGGLLSAVILAKEGKKVAVIEQNKQVGGCLQTFSFDKKIFDSCVHYIGALDEGQTQNRIFRYAGIMEDLMLEKLDVNCFDEILFADDKSAYPQAQGHQNFIDQLLPYFFKEKNTLKEYIDLLKKTGDSFPLYKLRSGDENEKNWIIDQELTTILSQLTPNPLLQNVLTGNNLLYAGRKGKTPFYVHALVVQSYIESAYKCIGGSSQISKLLWKVLRQNGGTVFLREKINQLHTQNGIIKSAVSENKINYNAQQFIANVHPHEVLKWIDSPLIKPSYRKRILEAENSISSFMVNIVFKPKTVKYRRKNAYWHKSQDTFAAIEQHIPLSWPENYALYFGEDLKNPGYADTMAILTYKNMNAFEPWAHTHNRSASVSARSAAYHMFKEEKAQQLMAVVAERFPELIEHIHSYKTATPLTFRDYMGTADGSMYGIMATAGQQERSKIPVFTKIPNLFLTGQNVGLHGILGVSISAVNTCAAILGQKYLLDKINA